MFRCGIAYPRCRWLMPLLLFFALIFDLIAIAAQSGWVEDEDAETHYASMWDECQGRNDNWECRSLMKYPWAQAVAALMIIGFILLVVAFIVSIYAMVNVSPSAMSATSGLLLAVAVIQIIALIIYPIKFNEHIFEGQYYYTWAYGFGWGATILCLGCSLLFCCLPHYEDELNGAIKVNYLYTSS